MRTHREVCGLAALAQSGLRLLACQCLENAQTRFTTCMDHQYEFYLDAVQGMRPRIDGVSLLGKIALRRKEPRCE